MRRAHPVEVIRAAERPLVEAAAAAGDPDAVMRRAAAGVAHLVVLSSATVYGTDQAGATEDRPTFATNPYGWTKVMQEQILRDIAVADPTLRFALLRYFNPVGAHASGTIGENPSGIPNRCG